MGRCSGPGSMRRRVGCLLLVLVLLSGCGGSGSGDMEAAFSRATAAERSAGTWRGLAVALLIAGVVAGIIMGSKARRDGGG